MAERDRALELERYELAARAGSEALWDWDLRRDRIAYAPRWSELLGVAPAAPDDSPELWLGRVHEEDRPWLVATFEAQIGGGGAPFQLEHRLRDGAGWRWLLCRGIAVADADGEPARLVGAVADITERKRAEEALRLSEERYALAAEAANDALYDWDVRADRIYYAPRWKALLGFAEGDIGDRPEEWLGRVHPEDLVWVRATVEAQFARPSNPFQIEYRIFDAGGRTRWMLCRGIGVADGDGAVVRLVGSQADITERKLAADEAERSARAKADFLATMSHELRTPLNAVIGLSEMLHEEAREDGPSGFVEPLGRIAAAGKHLLGLINAILELADLEAGRARLRSEAVPLGPLLRDLEAAVGPQAARRGNRLAVAPPPEGPEAALEADAGRLRQILLHLLGNAAKFTEGGEIALSVAAERRDGAPWLAFAVRDTGPGLSPEQAARLFQDFDGDMTDTRRHGGAGVGLAISRRMARLMGGDIGVESAPGRGSTFTLRLPLTPPG
ncbi:MAG TPA: PAS domain-containing protein [Alphaproteobacteria bacterium]|nr:PAS domain-containing protein [Alphaproteobacteria bacterium]